jgi:hypothetical protein
MLCGHSSFATRARFCTKNELREKSSIKLCFMALRSYKLCGCNGYKHVVASGRTEPDQLGATVAMLQWVQACSGKWKTDYTDVLALLLLRCNGYKHVVASGSIALFTDTDASTTGPCGERSLHGSVVIPMCVNLGGVRAIDTQGLRSVKSFCSVFSGHVRK